METWKLELLRGGYDGSELPRNSSSSPTGDGQHGN